MSEIDNMELKETDACDGFDGSHPMVQQTNYTKSLRHYITREALPSENNYRHLDSIVQNNGPPRATLAEMLQNTYVGQSNPNRDSSQADAETQGSKLKFGWIEGVFMRCLLNIWGVMLFLRVSWMEGKAGIWGSLLIVTCANIVTTITTISMSAIASNGQISGGGVYYMISRSLGPEFGGAIGLMFTLANSIAVAVYTIGFIDSLMDLLADYFGIDGIIFSVRNLADVRVFGSIVMFLLMVVAVIGMKLVTMIQQGLLVLLIAAQISFVVGAGMGPSSNTEMARGFVGGSMELFYKNMVPDWTGGGETHDFFSVFAVFFPAVTGIVAGANLSGDLKDPAKAIPRGTLLAIGITYVTYMVYPFIIAATCVRGATGDVEALEVFMLSPEYINGTASILDAPVFDCVNNECNFGTLYNFQVVALVSPFGPLIYAGCFAATLSSAIASLVGAPRVMQALAKDKIYPYTHVFAQSWGPNADPVFGYLLSFAIAVVCVMVAQLNVVSTILSNFFLASYCLINFSCFHASRMETPSFRPGFKFYNKYVSLLGAVLTIVVMFLIDYITALITWITLGALYVYVYYRSPDANWGSSKQDQVYRECMKQVLQLEVDHVKLFRISALVLTGNPHYRPGLVHFANLISKGQNMVILMHQEKEISPAQRVMMKKKGDKWMEKNHIKGFYQPVEAENLYHATKSALQCVGTGNFRPNCVYMGFKTDWRTCQREELKAYFKTIHNIFDMNMSCVMLRMKSGLDYSSIIEPDERDQSHTPPETPLHTTDNLLAIPGQEGTMSGNSTPPATPEPGKELVEAETEKETPKMTEEEKKKKRRSSISSLYHGPGGSKLSKDVLNELAFFQRKHKKGVIDVYWFFDDGGLTLLLPYILSQRAQWGDCKIRIFSLCRKGHELDSEQRSMAQFIAKFRIDYSDVIVVKDPMKRPSQESIDSFNDLLKDFRVPDEPSSSPDECDIFDTQYMAQKDKITRHLRWREICEEYSTQSDLIVMTMPLPRKSQVPAPLFMAYLDFISRDMPPFFFVRGNHQSVLTFYS